MVSVSSRWSSTLILILVVANPLISLVFGKQPYCGYVIDAILFCVLLINSFARKTFSLQVVMILAVATGCVYALSQEEELAKIYIHLFCYFDAVFFFILMNDEENRQSVLEGLYRFRKVIGFVVITINIVELLMMTVGNGYVDQFHWGGSFFQGTSSMPHTLAYLMVVAIAMVCLLLMFRQSKLWAVAAIVPGIAIYISGARIALLLGGMLILLIINRVLPSRKNAVAKSVAVLFIVSLMALIFSDQILSSPTVSKFLVRSGNINDFTAGRSYMWIDLMKRFIEDGSVFEWVFGRGDPAVYTYNFDNEQVRSMIWAHSDFLQILIGKGLLGFLFYTMAIASCFKSISKYSKGLAVWIILALIFFAALLNGFYSYHDMMMATPLLILIARYYKEDVLSPTKRIPIIAIRTSFAPVSQKR